jgi:hypothetical protein
MEKRHTIDQAAKLLMTIGGPNVADLVQWLDTNRKETEKLECYEWYEERWYIVITDMRSAEKSPGNMLIGFTVDVKADFILWANDKSHPEYPNGGNCFCRSDRWFRKLYKKFPQAKSDRVYPGKGNVHDYRPRKEKKLQSIGG